MAVGALTGGSNISKISTGTQIGTQLGGVVAGALITSAFAKEDAKKQRELEKELAKLDLAQKEVLAKRMQDVQGEVAKQAEYYKFLAEQNNNEMLNKLNSKRYTSYIILGVGVLVLAFVVISLKNKKNG